MQETQCFFLRIEDEAVSRDEGKMDEKKKRDDNAFCAPLNFLALTTIYCQHLRFKEHPISFFGFISMLQFVT